MLQTNDIYITWAVLFMISNDPRSFGGSGLGLLLGLLSLSGLLGGSWLLLGSGSGGGLLLSLLLDCGAGGLLVELLDELGCLLLRQSLGSALAVQLGLSLSVSLSDELGVLGGVGLSLLVSLLVLSDESLLSVDSLGCNKALDLGGL